MIDYALDLADVKTNDWFNSIFDQSYKQKITTPVILADHKITGVSMARIPTNEHMPSGMPAMGLLIRSQLQNIYLRPDHQTKVLDRSGESVSDFSMKQKNLRQRYPDERSLYVLNNREIKEFVDAGGYDNQYQFIHKLRGELLDASYQRVTRVQLIKLSLKDTKNQSRYGLAKNNKPKITNYYGVQSLESSPRFASRTTDNSFNYLIDTTFRDMERQLQAHQELQNIDVKLVQNQPRPMASYTPDIADRAVNSDYALTSGKSKGLDNDLNSTFNEDYGEFASMAPGNQTNNGIVNPMEESRRNHQHQMMRNNLVRNNQKSGSAAHRNKHIAQNPLHVRHELNLNSQAIKSDIAKAEGESGSKSNKSKHISRKPLSLSSEMHFNNDYDGQYENDDDYEDSENASMNRSIANSADDIDYLDDDDSDDSDSDEERETDTHGIPVKRHQSKLKNQHKSEPTKSSEGPQL